MKSTKLLLTTIFLLAIGFSSNAATSDFKKVLGSWEYSAPAASYPYSNGVIILKELDGKLVGEFNVQGQKIEAKTATFSDDDLLIRFEVENTQVVAKFKFENGLLKGSADTVEGSIPVTAKPKK